MHELVCLLVSTGLRGDRGWGPGSGPGRKRLSCDLTVCLQNEEKDQPSNALCESKQTHLKEGSSEQTSTTEVKLKVRHQLLTLNMDQR